MSNVGGNGTADLVPPDDLVAGVQARWPWSEWSNALAVSLNESDWEMGAEADTTDADHPCGTVVRRNGGIVITAEISTGYFQINLCNHDESDWDRLRTVDGNLDEAFALWKERSWEPWYLTALYLGL